MIQLEMPTHPMLRLDAKYNDRRRTTPPHTPAKETTTDDGEWFLLDELTAETTAETTDEKLTPSVRVPVCPIDRMPPPHRVRMGTRYVDTPRYDSRPSIHDLVYERIPPALKTLVETSAIPSNVVRFEASSFSAYTRHGQLIGASKDRRIAVLLYNMWALDNMLPAFDVCNCLRYIVHEENEAELTAWLERTDVDCVA